MRPVTAFSSDKDEQTTTLSPVRCTIDLAADGKAEGFLQVPHSTHASAYGCITIPIISIRNGEGPVVLATGGNHGDEYEGQLALSAIARDVRPADLRGQLIVIPCLNLPACLAGNRISPLDDGNLNRSFPGDNARGPTEMIAHYVERVLLPGCTTAIDLHSGGSSLRYLPGTMARLVVGPEGRAAMMRKIELMRAFGAPMGMIMTAGMGGASSFLAAAERAKVLALGTEIGGGGTTSKALVELARDGVLRVMAGLDAMATPPPLAGATDSTFFLVGGEDYFARAPGDGVFELWVEPGDRVEAGAIAGLLHAPETPWIEPVAVRFVRSGTVLAVRVPARTQRGDCLAHLGTDYHG